MYPPADSFGVQRARNAPQRAETAKAEAWGNEEQEPGAGGGNNTQRTALD